MKTLFVIDAYNLIYRMFYAIPEMNTREGRPVNAIFWVAKFLHALSLDNPDASIVVANDVGASFREKLFVEYKAQRDRMPDNLRSQIAWIFELFEASGIMVLSKEWYEADDIIGSIAVNCQKDSHQIVIISSDKDLCQFVSDGCVHIFDAMKRKFMKESDVLEKFGVPVHQVRDYLAIVWDASDNIPGISWFGPKKAVDLLSKYETLEWIYDHLTNITPKMAEILVTQKENAFLSQKLATIVTDLEIVMISELPFAPGLQKAEYMELLKKYEFRSLLPKDSFLTVKTSITLETHEIMTLSELEAIISRMRDVPGGKPSLFLSIWNDDTLAMSFEEQIFTIHLKTLDITSLVDFIFENPGTLIGYDIKSDLKKLLCIKNPLEKWISEGQGKLF